MSYVAPGMHLLIDLWECQHLQDMMLIERTMREAAQVCGATVLDVKLPLQGPVTVAVRARYSNSVFAGSLRRSYQPIARRVLSGVIAIVGTDAQLRALERACEGHK